MKELTKDILFMLWGFIGSTIIGGLFALSDAGMITGNVLLATNYIKKTFLSLGFAFIALLAGLLLIKNKKLIWKKKKQF
jgi:hypothetical protein